MCMTHSLTSLLQDWSVHVELCSHLLLKLKYSEALKKRKNMECGFLFWLVGFLWFGVCCLFGVGWCSFFCFILVFRCCFIFCFQGKEPVELKEGEWRYWKLADEISVYEKGRTWLGVGKLWLSILERNVIGKKSLDGKNDATSQLWKGRSWRSLHLISTDWAKKVVRGTWVE